MKKQRRISMTDKMKPSRNLQAIGLLVLLALLTAGCYPATLAPPQENLRSKQLTPPPGKALVYFYLDHSVYDWQDVDASLNGFKSRISTDAYVLWEVFPGEYLLTFPSEDYGIEIQCEANKIYYYEKTYKSVFDVKFTQVSPATGRVKINELSLVKWFKDIPAPPGTEATVGQEVAVEVAELAEPAQVSPDEAIAILEVKIDEVGDESTTFYDPGGKPLVTVSDYCVFSPREHIRSSLIQAKFRIASEDTKETPVATLAVRYEEKNKSPGLGSPKRFFLSYEVIHHTRGKLFEGGVGPQGCDTQEKFENHPQFRDIGLLVRDAFIRSEVKAAKNAENTQEIDPAVAANTSSAPEESARPGEKSESTTIVVPVPPTSSPAPFAIRDPKFEAAYKGECDTDATIMSVDGNSFGAGGQISIREGAFTLWCYGAKHTWEGRLTYANHVFDSDDENPLQFVVDKDKGYVYLGGKGTVTLPDGTAVTLPAGDPDADSDAVDTEQKSPSAQQQSADTAKSNKSPATRRETRIPFSKGEVVKIESISAIVGQGEAFFSNSEEPGMLNLGVDGTTPVVDGMSCLFCVNTVKIGPNTKVPLSFLTERSEKGRHGGKITESITVKNISLTGPRVADDATEYILSGDSGATLQKESNGFILLEGEAYYVKNVDSEDYTAADKTDNAARKDPELSDTLLPPFTSPLKGSNEVRVKNPNDFGVTVGLRSEEKGRDFQVAAYGVSSAFVPNGKYRIYFVYSNKPDALFEGDAFSLDGNGVEIQIVKVVGGNYGIKRVK